MTTCSELTIFENVAAVNDWNDEAKLLWLKARIWQVRWRLSGDVLNLRVTRATQCGVSNPPERQERELGRLR